MTETFRRQNHRKLPETSNIITDEIAEITETVVIQGFNKLKNRNSPDEEQIPNEFLKYEYMDNE